MKPVITKTILSILFISASSVAVACKQTSLSRSTKIINAILLDVSENYAFSGAGGISQIKQLATTSYKISIPEEERVYELIYEVTTAPDCKVRIIKRSKNVKSF